MSPLMYYILNVIKQDMASHPNAYWSRDPLKYLENATVYHRNVLSEEPIPWSYP